MQSHPFLELTQFRQIEKVASSKYKLDLIDRAGNAIVAWINSNITKVGSILVLVGSGNNGADAVSAAIKLKEQYKHDVTLLLTSDKSNSNSQKLITQFKKLKGKVLTTPPANFKKYSLIIDGIVGIGINKANFKNELATLINQVNSSKVTVLALDTPSGIDPFSGNMANTAIKANYTITFIADKIGLHTGFAVDHCGEITVMPLVDLDNYEIKLPKIEFNLLENIDHHKLIRSIRNTSKGNFGNIAIIGGGSNMHGALYLAGRAAFLTGCGRVILGFVDKNFTCDYQMPELIATSAKQVMDNLNLYDVVVVGPGLGMCDKALKALTKIIEMRPKIQMIFDADALNLIAKNEDLQYLFRMIPNKIITPHPLEAARLLDQESKTITLNRLATLHKLSEKFNAITLLKGAGSLISSNGAIFINQFANPTLSSAGNGDTLCGIIASLIAQGLDATMALRFAIYLHGRSGNELASTYLSNKPNSNYDIYNGISASEIALYCRKLLNEILYK